MYEKGTEQPTFYTKWEYRLAFDICKLANYIRNLGFGGVTAVI